MGCVWCTAFAQKRHPPLNQFWFLSVEIKTYFMFSSMSPLEEETKFTGIIKLNEKKRFIWKATYGAGAVAQCAKLLLVTPASCITYCQLELWLLSFWPGSPLMHWESRRWPECLGPCYPWRSSWLWFGTTLATVAIRGVKQRMQALLYLTCYLLNKQNS